MIYKHIKPKYKNGTIQPTNFKQGTNVNEVEITLLALQTLVDKKIEAGKKGIKLDDAHKISYKKLKKMIYALNEFFAYKGCMSFGICASCENFKNSGTSSGVFGYCKNTQEKFRHAFDTCEEYTGEGGFGLK